MNTNTTIENELTASRERLRTMHLDDERLVMIDDEELAHMAFETNIPLRKEFRDQGTFLAYWRQLRRARGLSVGTGKKDTVTTRPDESAEDTEALAWNGSIELQREFGGVFSTYVAFRKNDKAGRIRIAGRR